MQRHYFASKPPSQSMAFPVLMLGCESWTIKRLNAEELMLLNCGVGEDSCESLGLQEIKPVNPKGNQSWIFIRRTDAETQAPILWPSDEKSWLVRKDPDVGKDWRREEKGTTEDEMVGWHDWLNGHEFEQAPVDDDGQGSLACYSPWYHEESDTTERLNNNNKVPLSKAMVNKSMVSSSSVQLSSVAQSCLTLCNPMDCSMPASLSITNSWNLLKLIHWVSDTFQSSHPLSSPSPPAYSLSQHQGPRSM